MVNNKHIFWQAFIAAAIIFWIGLLVGISYEKGRIEEIQDFYFDSQSDLSDFELSSRVVFNSDLDCGNLYEKGVHFADDIFREASKLEKYDDSNKLTEELIGLHRRYDILRTSLWIDLSDVDEKCEEEGRNIVIYLYDYVDPSLTTRAAQGAMSSFLVELKGKYGNDIILIPIAADTDVDAIDDLREIYGLEEIPTVFVNNKYRFNFDSLNQIESYLNKQTIKLN